MRARKNISYFVVFTCIRQQDSSIIEHLASLHVVPESRVVAHPEVRRVDDGLDRWRGRLQTGNVHGLMPEVRPRDPRRGARIGHARVRGHSDLQVLGEDLPQPQVFCIVSRDGSQKISPPASGLDSLDDFWSELMPGLQEENRADFSTLCGKK